MSTPCVRGILLQYLQCKSKCLEVCLQSFCLSQDDIPARTLGVLDVMDETQKRIEKGWNMRLGWQQSGGCIYLVTQQSPVEIFHLDNNCYSILRLSIE